MKVLPIKKITLVIKINWKCGFSSSTAPTITKIIYQIKKIGVAWYISNMQSNPDFELVPTYQFPIDCQWERYP